MMPKNIHHILKEITKEEVVLKEKIHIKFNKCQDQNLNNQFISVIILINMMIKLLKTFIEQDRVTRQGTPFSLEIKKDQIIRALVKEMCILETTLICHHQK